MKRETFIRIMTDRGYQLGYVEDGIDIYDGFGWRAFVSDKIRYGMNTCSLELNKVDYDILNRYVRTPLEKR